MTYYLISFPAEAMDVSEQEFPQVVIDSHAVVQEAKDAGVWVFGGGVVEEIAPVLVASDGAVSTEIYPGSKLTGGLSVLDLPDRAAAELWASRIAAACRCAQEVRELQ